MTRECKPNGYNTMSRATTMANCQFVQIKPWNNCIERKSYDTKTDADTVVDLRNS
jgi:hypothetical protein